MTFKTIPAGRNIRMAFLGCGKITAKHSKLLKKRGDVQLSFASRSEDKARDYAGRFGSGRFFTSYESAIHSPDTDVIFIATPPHNHLDLALRAIQAGKHVMVEKPPFLHAADFDRIAAERKKTGVQVMITENYFYKPVLRKLRKILQTDVIGDIRFLYFNATKTQRNDDWRDDQSIAGGGALLEGGIHWINFISNLGPEPASVHGFQPAPLAKGPERSMQVVMTYAGGPVGTLLYSWEVNALINGLRLSRIYGTRGSVTFESNGIFIFIRGKKWRFILPGFADIGGTKAMFEDFLQALRTGEEPAFSLELARRDMVFIEKAYGGRGEQV